MSKYKTQLINTVNLLTHDWPEQIIPEYRFHHKRKWRFDLAIPGRKIAFEYEGLAYRGGKSGHTTLGGFTKNCEKYNEAQIEGWKVYRFTAEMMKNGMFENQILRVLGG